MITSNYGNREVDLLIHQGVSTEGERQVALSLGLEGSVCTGVQKAAQFFTRFFLTDLGSRLRDANFGCNFLSALNLGSINDENSLVANFRLAVDDLLEYQNNSGDVATEPDERISDAILERWDLRSGSLKMTVRVVTEAGDDRVIYLPVKVAIR